MTEDELSQAGDRNLRALLDKLRQATAMLVDLEPGHKFPRRRASGFVIEREGRVFVVSAGHALQEGRWWLELDPFKDGKHAALLVPLRSTWSLLAQADLDEDEVQQLDFAWAEIDIQQLREQVRQDKRLQDMQIDIPKYTGPLNLRPSPEGVYSYVALNRGEHEDHGFVRIVEREPSFEYGMDFLGDDEARGVYVFRLGREHQGHDYYYGASGAPIADAEGIIVSVVLRGSVERNELYGARLADFEQLVGAIE